MANYEIQLTRYPVIFHLTPDLEERLQKLTEDWNAITGTKSTMGEIFDFIMTVGSHYDISEKLSSFEQSVDRARN